VAPGQEETTVEKALLISPPEALEVVASATGVSVAFLIRAPVRPAPHRAGLRDAERIPEDLFAMR
jgi:hypothetical protein